MPGPESTSLTSLHHASDSATFVDFGGVALVHTFGEPQAEYAAIRKACGLFDAPHRGVLAVGGKDRHEFLGNLITNKTWDRVARVGMAAGTGAYAFFLNLKGRIVADLTLVERGDELLIDTDRRLVAMLAGVLDKYRFSEKVTFADRTASHARLSLFGPGAAAIVADAGGVDVSALPAYGSVDVPLFGGTARVWREDLTASTGLHLLVEQERLLPTYRGLLDAFGGLDANKRRLRPVGWAAFNTCRVEAGRPMLGIDYEPAAPSVPGKRKDDAPEDPAAKGILPAETGLFDRAIDVTKGCYLGQEIVARMHARKVVARQIVGFRMRDDALPTAGAAVVDPANVEQQVGIVTSSTESPVLSNACVGLALVKRPLFEVGTELLIWAEGSMRPAQVVAVPQVP